MRILPLFLFGLTPWIAMWSAVSHLSRGHALATRCPVIWRRPRFGWTPSRVPFVGKRTAFLLRGTTPALVSSRDAWRSWTSASSTTSSLAIAILPFSRSWNTCSLWSTSAPGALCWALPIASRPALASIPAASGASLEEEAGASIGSVLGPVSKPSVMPARLKTSLFGGSHVRKAEDARLASSCALSKPWPSTRTSAKELPRTSSSSFLVATVYADKKGFDPSIEIPVQSNPSSPDNNFELSKAFRMISRVGMPCKKDGVQCQGHPSNREDKPVFDLSSASNSFDAHVLPSHWLRDTNRLKLRSNHFKKARAAGAPWPRFTASSTFAEWIPPRAGAASSPDDKIKNLREWKSNSSGSSPSHASGMIASFQLSYAALTTRDVRDMVPHVRCFPRMHSNFGMDLAISYEQRLPGHIHLYLRLHFVMDSPNLLDHPVQYIMNEPQFSRRRTKDFVPRRADFGEAYEIGEGRSKAKNRQTSDPLPPAESHPSVFKEILASLHEPEKGKPLNVVGMKERSGSCFKEDTAIKTLVRFSGVRLSRLVDASHSPIFE
ncbi:unnamed protein product [Polarella glacialis]|uniref:Uncharacterized protein n=1 Tax=Polarella glacialis TaxID=89957 RepID=A0A813ESE0_POLGL|nr:unnamed protein product [Polarella glacialis]